MAGSEDARWIVSGLPHADRWRDAIEQALTSLDPGEVVLCAGASGWIRGDEPDPAEHAYYFVTQRGLHFGSAKREKRRFSSKTTRADVFVSRPSVAYARTDGRNAVQFHREDGDSLALVWFDDVSDQFVRQDDAPSSSTHHWECQAPFAKAVNLARALGVQTFENERKPAPEVAAAANAELPAEYERRFGPTYNERLAATLLDDQTNSRASANANLLVARMLVAEGKLWTDELAEVVLWAHLADRSLGYREIAAELGVDAESVAHQLLAAASREATRWPPGTGHDR